MLFALRCSHGEKVLEQSMRVDRAAAACVDTDLSFLSFHELYRADASERRVTPGRVVASRCLEGLQA
jgi:hypothetical protein